MRASKTSFERSRDTQKNNIKVFDFLVSARVHSIFF